MRKQAGVEASPAVRKQAKFLGTPALESRAAWRLSGADQSGPFSWANITDAQRRGVWARMSEFEKMTPSQLLSTGSHRVSQSRMAKEAKERLRRIELDDLEELWSFRVTGRQRFWCMKRENVYSLLWWDPDHRVCPSLRD